MDKDKGLLSPFPAPRQRPPQVLRQDPPGLQGPCGCHAPAVVTQYSVLLAHASISHQSLGVLQGVGGGGRQEMVPGEPWLGDGTLRLKFVGGAHVTLSFTLLGVRGSL